MLVLKWSFNKYVSYSFLEKKMLLIDVEKTSINFRENVVCIVLPIKGLFTYLPRYTLKLKLQIGLDDLC